MLDPSDRFTFSVECKLYLAESENTIGDSSTITPGEFVGWVSLTTEDVELSDRDVYSLLDVAHIESELARSIVDLCVSPADLRRVGGTGTERIEVEDVWISGSISQAYLESLDESFDGAYSVSETLAEYETGIEVIEQ